MRKLSNAVRTMILAEELGCWGIHLGDRLIELSKRPTVERMLSAQLAVASLNKVLGYLADCLITEGEGHGG